MKIGYLGPTGSYSHEAALEYGRHLTQAVEPAALTSFPAIISSVESGQFDYGILPVENSTHGAVATAMDELLKLRAATVCGEVILDIEHCLLVEKHSRYEVRHIYSHEQALEQCRDYLRRCYPNAELIKCVSTSEACERTLKGANRAAVASRMAARCYSMAVAAENIQDNAFNQTRFLIISGKQPAPTGRDKTSIVFAFPGDRPGSLYMILKSFADYGVNLTRIESRPAKDIMGKYIFYVDFIGHQNTEVGSAIIREISPQVNWLKVLGSYPEDSCR